MTDDIRRKGHSRLRGRPLDENGAIKLTVQYDSEQETYPSPRLGDGDAMDWISAAKQLGEQLAPDGPNGYYGFTPQQWFDWALSRVDALRQQLAEAKKQLIKLTHDCQNSQAFAVEYRKQLVEAEAERERLKAEMKFDEAALSQASDAAIERGDRLEALTTSLSALVEKWNSEYQSALEHDRKHGLRESTVELGGKAIAADELAALLASHPEQP